MNRSFRSLGRSAGSAVLRSIRKLSFSFGLLLAIAAGGAVLLSGPQAMAQSASSASRVVYGKVFAPGGAPQANAIVYLKDGKSLEIKTYISTQDGSYRFVQLGTQNDYLLWAEFNGQKSKTKTISSFDSKKTFDISLHLEDK